MLTPWLITDIGLVFATLALVGWFIHDGIVIATGRKP